MVNPDQRCLPEFALRWLAQWRIAGARLDELRRQELSAMTEADAARIFDQLDPVRPYELRLTSGLVEQQRWFGKFAGMLVRDAVPPLDRTG